MDFGALNFRIVSTDGKTVLAELQAIDAAGQRVGKNSERTREHVARAGDALHGRFSKAVLVSTAALENMSRAGEVTAGAMRQVMTQTANMAFAFGVGGPLVAAAGVATMALVNMFTRARDEMERTARAFDELVMKFRRSGDIMGAAATAQAVFSGDRFALQGEGESAVAFDARRLGVLGVREKIAQLEADRARTVHASLGLEQQRRTAIYNLLVQYRAELEKLEGAHARVMAAVNELAAAEGKRAQSALDSARYWKQQEIAKTEAALTGLLNGMDRALPSIRVTRGTGAALTDAAARALQESMTDAMKRRPPTLPVNEWATAWIQAAEGIAMRVGGAIADALTAGITAAFQKGANVGTAFAALGGAVLQGLGEMFQQVGVAALVGLQLMQRIKEAILAFAPGLGIAAALGLIVLGGVLKGAGGRMMANASGFNGGVGPSATGGGPQDDYARIVLPNTSAGAASAIQPAPPVNITVIGENDPAAQRTIMNLVRNARSRGLTDTA